MRRVLILAIAIFIMMSVSAYAVNAYVPEISGVSGIDDISTSVEVSKEGWNTADTVVITRVDEFPDALAGTVLAYKEDAPIFLTYSHSLSSRIKGEIQRLGADKAILLGGEVALSSSVENELQQMGLHTERIGGDTRYETAKLIARKIGISDKAVIAYGENFPDALAVAPYAAKNQIPILLTLRDQVPEVTQNALSGVQETIIVGGPAVISESVKYQLPAPIRVSGQDRYGTALSILKELDMSYDKVYCATGLDFSNVLIGSVLAAKDDAPILLVRDDRIPSIVENVIKENSINELIVIGNTDIEGKLNDIFNEEKVSNDEDSYEELPLIDRMRNDKFIQMLNMSKQEIITKLGDPDVDDWWAGNYFYYEDVSSSIRNNVDGVTDQTHLMVWFDQHNNAVMVYLDSFLNIEKGMSFTEAIDMLDKELEVHKDDVSGEFGTYYIRFSVKDFTISFYSDKSSDGPIDSIYVDILER